MTFKRYANITEEQREMALTLFDEYCRINPYGDVGHAAACIAADRRMFGMTNKQWNSKIGGDAWTAILGILVMNKKVNLELPQ